VIRTRAKGETVAPVTAKAGHRGFVLVQIKVWLVFENGFV
jgi:hypothetical protein